MGTTGSWNSLALLAALILSSCFILTEGQPATIQIQLEPLHPIEGQAVTLTPTPRSDVEKALTCRWYRGLGTEADKLIYTYYFSEKNGKPEVAATGRETVGPGCSLLIRNLTFADTGNYSVNLDGLNINTVLVHASVVVSENLTSPVLNTSADLVAEYTDVTLNCTTSNNPDVRVSWFKDGNPLPAHATLSDRDRILTLIGVTYSDKGLYRCRASNQVSKAESNSVNLTVAYGPVVHLIPDGVVEKSLNSDLTLECIVQSVPEARIQWFFNDIKRNATGRIFQVRLSNWTDEGNYTCQATNPFTNHSDTRTAYVKLVDGPVDSGLSGGAIAGIVIGSLAGVALVAGLLYFICTKTSFGRMELHTSNGNVPSAPGHNQGVTDTKPKAADEDLQYSILAFKDSNRSPPWPSSEAPQPPDGVTIYSEIKKK